MPALGLSHASRGFLVALADEVLRRELGLTELRIRPLTSFTPLRTLSIRRCWCLSCVAGSHSMGSGAIAFRELYMEQRRFFEVRGEEGGEWLVLDGKRHPPRVICRCLGWHAPKDAALIATALEAYHSELYAKLHLGGPERHKQQPAVKASDEAQSRPKAKPATKISRTKPRG